MTQATLSSANVSNTAVIQTKSFTPKDIDRIFKAQKKKALELRLTNFKTRIQKLKKLKDVVLKYQTEIQKALHSDFKKSAGEVDITEILPTIAEINDAIRHIKHWMRPKNVMTPPTLLGATSRIVYEPKGVCLIIAPWNYPFHLAIAPLAAAIAAGNTVMLKPSEFTPNTANVINSMLGEIFSEEEVAVFEGDVSVATALLEIPFDHIFFTGSTPVGKIVMAAAAKNLTSVTLELGGKSPSIIAEDADLKVAAERIMWGKFLNAGQTCVAPDYLLIPESKVEEFVKHAKDTTESFFKSKPENFAASTDFCRIVNAKNFSRVSSYIDDAVKKGAKIAYGGEVRSSDNFIAPTILNHVPLDSKIMEDEIFGPLLPIVTYKSLDDAIHIINERPKPLALYIFTKKRSTSKYVLRRTSSGGAVINDVILHLVNPNLPFGGVNHSGHGSYHGIFGFKTFSHERSVLQTPKASIAKLMYPPYSGFVRLMVKLTTKFFV
ncbi:aldehyde dehydrogenase family protein [Leptospira bouyouniensis]|uniref:Aldehyde dehydrogenase n=1 Tax=Leptospira bouyouniensis TaxID=2484911 RepID=A0A7I0HWC6_9LEPT|nr:aldehyde dehydrogenase family protein [Leptospira bouyouniensis]TGL08494.1 aldehyde dehydrogenase family protein [Leptospira bouyouniensis]